VREDANTQGVVSTVTFPAEVADATVRTLHVVGMIERCSQFHDHRVEEQNADIYAYGRSDKDLVNKRTNAL